MPSGANPRQPDAPPTHATVIDAEPDAARARALLPAAAYDYFAGSAGDERTYHANLAAFRALRFRPRFLRDVSNVDTAVSLPGIGTLPAPLLIAPMAMQKLAHAHGELAVARAAARVGVPYVLSTFATTPVEQVAAALQARTDGHPPQQPPPPPPLLMQIYVFRDRAATLALARRAAAAGAVALVLTVDAPFFGRRARGAARVFGKGAAQTLRLPHVAGMRAADDRQGVGFDAVVDASVTGAAIRELARASGLPVWVKGVLRGDDAAAAVRGGAGGVIVSNHGARQLEGALPSLHALAEVVAAVGDRVPVLVDSGVRSGEDVVRALALGARAVLLGRPVLWAAAADGERGVEQLLRRVCEETRLTMALVGARCAAEVTRDLVTTTTHGEVDGGAGRMSRL